MKSLTKIKMLCDSCDLRLNKKFHIVLVAFLWIVIQAHLVAQSHEPKRLDLKECIEFTLKHHPTSSIYRNEIDLSREKIRESRSDFLPSISGNASFDYNIKLQTSVIPAGSFGPEETELQIGNKYSTEIYLQADQNIFDRALLVKIKSAKVEEEISDLNVLKENETLIYNSASAYYQVLTYKEKGRLLRENEMQYRQLLEIVRLRYDQGVAKKNEYDRTRVNFNNIQAELALNESNYHLSLNTLKNAMGMDLQATISIDDSVSYVVPVAMPEVSDLNTSELVSYEIDQKNMLLKDINVQEKRAAYFPTFSAYAKYGVNVYGSELSNAFDHWFNYSVVGVRLNVPVFSGFKRSSQLIQSKISLQNQRLKLKLSNDNYQLDYQNSGAKLFSSYTNLIKNKENMQLAKEVLDITGVEYREGTTTFSTYLDDDYSYKEAQTNYITSLLDFLIANLSFEKAKGTLITYIQEVK